MLPTREELERAAVRYGLDRVDVSASVGGGQVVRVQRGAAVAHAVVEAADLAGALFPAEISLRRVRLLARELDRAA